MTEKQYRLNKWGTRLLKNNRPLFDWFNDSDEIVDLLNELDGNWIDEFSLRETLQLELQRVEEENKQLKTDNGAFIQDIEVYKEENTHLKLENEQLKSSDTITDLETEIMKLEEENEKLKTELKDCHKSNHEYYIDKDKLIRLCTRFNIDWKKELEE